MLLRLFPQMLNAPNCCKLHTARPPMLKPARKSPPHTCARACKCPHTSIPHSSPTQLDILVANAGVMGKLERPEDMADANWENVLK